MQQVSSSMPNADTPVAIGGVGGSGTRVVTKMLLALGYFMGERNNSAHDNLWFRFLLKRPEWFMRYRTTHPEHVDQGVRTFASIMTGPLRPSPRDVGFLLNALAEQKWRGLKRLRKLCFRRPVDFSSYRGWGWKEPNTYLYLDFLYRRFPRMKYIHTIRHGLDMAYSRTTGQLQQWAAFFDLRPPASVHELPERFLEFWIRANRYALAVGEKAGPARFHLLNFDRLCEQPAKESQKLVEFLELDPPEATLRQIASLPRTPRSTGRYRLRDLSIFSPAQIDAVRAYGFAVDPVTDRAQSYAHHTSS